MAWSWVGPVLLAVQHQVQVVCPLEVDYGADTLNEMTE